MTERGSSKTSKSYLALCRSWQRFAENSGGTFSEAPDHGFFGEPSLEEFARECNVDKEQLTFMQELPGCRPTVATVTIPYKGWSVEYQPTFGILYQHLIRVSTNYTPRAQFCFAFHSSPVIIRPAEKALDKLGRFFLKRSGHDITPMDASVTKTGNKQMDQHYEAIASSNVEHLVQEQRLIEALASLDRVLLISAIGLPQEEALRSPNCISILQFASSFDTAQLTHSQRFIELLLDSLHSAGVIADTSSYGPK